MWKTINLQASIRTDGDGRAEKGEADTISGQHLSHEDKPLCPNPPLASLQTWEAGDDVCLVRDPPPGGWSCGSAVCELGLRVL